LTYNGATITGGYLQGAGTHVLTGGTSVIGTTTDVNATVNQTGTATLTNFNNGGGFTNSAALTWSGGQNQSGGRLTVNDTLNASNWTNNGIATIATTGTVNYTGGNLYLGGGSQTYVGSSSSPNTGGTITMAAGTTIELNGGLLVNNGTIGSSGAGLVDINYGGLAKGAGNYAGGYSVNFGGKLQPGNSPGLLGSGSSVWNGGGSFTFMINNATGTAGTNWSSNVINGTLTINATSSSQFGISIQSLTSGNAPGAVPNFDPTQSYTWTFLQTSGGIIGFNQSAIALDTSGFTNSYTGQFYLASTGYNLEIEYSPTPEPEHLLGICGLAALLICFLRRRRSAAPFGSPC
jgi:hypothetical protein